MRPNRLTAAPAAPGRLTRLALAAFVAALAVAAHAPGARAQVLAGGGHTIYGDFTVDESKAGSASVPFTFDLLLQSENGTVIDRTNVMAGGRYRFINVRNGVYDIIVESENREITRIRMNITSLYKTDFRQDIGLAWTANPGGAKAGTVDAASLYKRTSANQSLFGKADAAVRKKAFEEAAALFRQVVAADPKDYQAWTELGTMNYAMGKAEEAEAAYTRALQEKPDFLTAALNLGRLRVARKDFDKAVETLTAAVERHPQSAEAHHLLGEAYLQSKRGSKAVGHLDEAVRLDPQGKADIHLRLAALYNGAGLKERAAAEYEQFLKKKPDHPDRQKFQKYVDENKKK